MDTGERAVIKKVDCHSKLEVERTRREINIHQKFGNHENIISILAAAETKGLDGGTRFFLIFPYRNVKENIVVIKIAHFFSAWIITSRT